MEFRLSVTLGHEAELEDFPTRFLLLLLSSAPYACLPKDRRFREGNSGSGSFLTTAEKERTVAVQ